MRSVPRAALLLCFVSVGCPGQQSDMQAADGGLVTCKSDDDCDAQPVLRACRNRQCGDPGCPAGATFVAAGSFTQGCSSNDADCDTNAQPVHAVTLTHGFCISKTELSVAQYRDCVSNGHCAAPADLQCTSDFATWTPDAAANEALPMSCLLWSEAKAACTHLGGRLPTEAEWEKAARGRDRRTFPWGNTAPVACDRGANWAGPSCTDKPWEVTADGRQGAMQYSASYAVDMAGNLWEWTADYYAEDAYASCGGGCADPQGPSGGILRSRRGGSFQSPLTKELRTWFREFDLPEDQRYDGNGVRCVFPVAH